MYTQNVEKQNLLIEHAVCKNSEMHCIMFDGLVVRTKLVSIL